MIIKIYNGIVYTSRDPHDPLVTSGSPFANVSDQKHNVTSIGGVTSLRISHGLSGPSFKTWFPPQAEFGS